MRICLRRMIRSNRPVNHVVVVTLSLVSAACCNNYYTSLPSPPAETSGWIEKTEGSKRTVGSFVLKVGESTASDKLGVTLVEFHPSRSCIGPLSEPSPTRLLIRMYRPPDGKLLCETTVFIAGHLSWMSGTLHCDDDTLPSSFTVRAFNAKEKWVWLELSSTADDSAR